MNPEFGGYDTNGGQQPFNRTTSQMKGLGTFSDTTSAINVGGGDPTANYMEKEKRALIKIKQQQKREIESMLESELIKQSMEIKAQEKLKKIAIKQAQQ